MLVRSFLHELLKFFDVRTSIIVLIFSFFSADKHLYYSGRVSGSTTLTNIDPVRAGNSSATPISHSLHCCLTNDSCLC